MRIDIFCRVVDNFGDAGVTWRLARQLATEHGARVTLRIDAPRALEGLAPAGERHAETGDGRVAVHALREDQHPAELPDLVVEGFGCGLPDAYLSAMASAGRPPVWLNLEYLSAEPWIETVHGLSSPQPRLPLVRHFFFPGFTRATGGLLRERGLLERRNAARSQVGVSPIVDRLRANARGSGGKAQPCVVSLFCYANRALPGLLDTWAEAESPLLCIVPEGVATPSFDAWLEGAVPHAGQTFTRGALTVATVPFMTQDEYDRLLWACDVNFVRGEDSFVRAQWAAQPFVWHIYPQSDDAHRVKLEAFLDRYLADAPPAVERAVRAFWRTWNGMGADDAAAARNGADRHDAAAAWNAYVGVASDMRAHNDRWAARLASLPDLAGALLEFWRARL